MQKGENIFIMILKELEKFFMYLKTHLQHVRRIQEMEVKYLIFSRILISV